MIFISCSYCDQGRTSPAHHTHLWPQHWTTKTSNSIVMLNRLMFRRGADHIAVQLIWKSTIRSKNPTRAATMQSCSDPGTLVAKITVVFKKLLRRFVLTTELWNTLLLIKKSKIKAFSSVETDCNWRFVKPSEIALSALLVSAAASSATRPFRGKRPKTKPKDSS